MTQHEVYRQAIARREMLRNELHDIEQFIELFEKYFGSNYSSIEQSNEASLASCSRGVDDAPNKRRNNPKVIADLAEKAIESAGRPLQRGELVDIIEGMGVPIHSEDKPRYIGTILWRNEDRFENIEGKGYWLKARKIPDYESLFQ